MRLYLVLLLLFPSILFCQKKRIETIFRVIHFNNEIELEDKSELETIALPNIQMLFVPDSAKYKALTFTKNAANYYRLGRNILYLSPGDSLVADIDYNNPLTAKFSGTHAVENEYLRSTPYPKAGSFLDAGDEIKATIDETIFAIILKSEQRANKLDSVKHRVDNHFYTLEKARIRADIINSLNHIFDYYVYINKIGTDSLDEVKKAIQKGIEPYLKKYCANFLNSDYLKLVVYRDVLATIIQYQPVNTKTPQKILDWIVAKNIKAKLQNLNNKTEMLQLEEETKSIKDIIYRAAILNTIGTYSKLTAGDSAVDFMLTDTKGNTIELSAYKNKVIYLSLWATWCGPCIAKMPLLNQLKAKYKERNDIVILSVSIDDNTLLWSEFIAKNYPQLNEYIVNRTKLSAYNVLSVPRAIIIDKNFTIIELHAGGPESKKLEQQLLDLVNKE
ncbi:MAG: TlpA family protein disulfide reductase [Chitinophagaceae bacterium]|nr:TlpA family protein disulfide reductase [Chitinophagaceae bacterium]